MLPNCTIQVPSVFKPIFSREYLDYILESGRNAGKSKNAYILCGIYTAEHPDEDVIICRASYGSIKDSAYNEVQEVIENIPQFEGQFIFRSSPLRIIRKNKHKSTIYFMGVGGSTDRTKGIKPKNKVGMLIIEEAQELRTREHYDQLLASMRRRFGKDCIVVTIFNPPAQELHWINVWSAQKKLDNDYCVIHSSWQDISAFLNDRDIREIIKCKYENKTYYDYMYLGIPSGAGNSVFPMFRKDIHLIPYDERATSRMLQNFNIRAVIIGCDGAVTHDDTVFSPLFIFENGQACFGKYYRHRPLQDGVKGSFPLVENEGKRWFSDLLRENNLNNPYDYMNSIPILFVVDSAATELVQALKYYFGNRAEVYPIKKGTILQMVDVVQSAIGKNVIGVYDYGGYYNYTSNQWINCENEIAYQFQMLRWNEKQTGYDPTIPNDASDSATYAIYFWFTQTENMVWLSDINDRRKQIDYYVLK